MFSSFFVALRPVGATALLDIVTCCCSGVLVVRRVTFRALVCSPVAFRIAHTTVHAHPVQKYYEGSPWRDVHNPHGLMERRVPEKPGPRFT